jgi:site-specific DNA recombinase
LLKRLDYLFSNIKPKVRDTRTYRLVSKGRWSPKTVWRILRNVAYIGLREVNVKHKAKDSNSLKTSQVYQVVKASWPPIIDREDFDEAQRVLDESELFQRQRLNDQERRIFLLTGLLACGECGAPIGGAAAHGKKQAHRYYVIESLLASPSSVASKDSEPIK